jgi:hypothetical protein
MSLELQKHASCDFEPGLLAQRDLIRAAVPRFSLDGKDLPFPKQNILNN